MTTKRSKPSVNGTSKKRPVRTRNKRAVPVPKSGRVSSLVPMSSYDEIDLARRKFEEGLISRGEAAPDSGPLPSGATHVINGRDSDKRPILKRKRFSAR
ncbi:MAG: hypothetical protein ACRENS_06220 [Candidatus Eiseniibacteriota bacterium]